MTYRWSVMRDAIPAGTSFFAGFAFFGFAFTG
jgi:hypothetical protein